MMNEVSTMNPGMSKRLLELADNNLCVSLSESDGLGTPQQLVIAHTEYDDHDIEYWLVYRESIDVAHTEQGQWYFVDGVLIEPDDALSEESLIRRYHCNVEKIWIGDD